jgi:hypothetical protein
MSAALCEPVRLASMSRQPLPGFIRDRPFIGGGSLNRFFMALCARCAVPEPLRPGIIDDLERRTCNDEESNGAGRGRRGIAVPRLQRRHSATLRWRNGLEPSDPVDCAIPKSSRQEPKNVGTLWSMRRFGRDARCTLLDRAGKWELRIVSERRVLLAYRCPRGEKAFTVAEAWRRRMLEQGWRQVVPRALRNDASERRPAARIAFFPAR